MPARRLVFALRDCGVYQVRIRKTYKEVNPELLYDEVKDFVQKQGVVEDEARLQTYSLPGGSSHIVRGTLAYRSGAGGSARPCFRAHIVGSAAGETKLMLDVDDTAFPADKLAAVQEDLDFIFGAYEIPPR